MYSSTLCFCFEKLSCISFNFCILLDIPNLFALDYGCVLTHLDKQSLFFTQFSWLPPPNFVCSRFFTFATFWQMRGKFTKSSSIAWCNKLGGVIFQFWRVILCYMEFIFLLILILCLMLLCNLLINKITILFKFLP